MPPKEVAAQHAWAQHERHSGSGDGEFFSVCLCFCVCCHALGFATSCCVADGLSLPLGISALNTSRCGDPVENKLCMRLDQKLTPLGREAHLVTVGHSPLLKRRGLSVSPSGGRIPWAVASQRPRWFRKCPTPPGI